MQEAFLTALIEKLRTESTLVTLTNHKTTDIRIARSSPAVAGKRPFLGVSVLRETGELIFCSVVGFFAYSTEELAAQRIIDELKTYFVLESGDNESKKYDFSDTNVQVKSTKFISRLQRVFDDSNKTWLDSMTVDITWTYGPCS